ncbi:PEP-CTERM sorting domain-containing protein [Pontiella agarivorans]|uniref:PEP-CTERM sorting domain-containing protein n=1 Tax=Pontiella agarivorans TaxID=3038953 RepID=A0ABU5MU90_9BACT|nr:PEP-CTERM sorting domain-containing protein [Pontiella agarivorans]MDZ8117771.1 PEP-CTERM sorting domain-containing protein [Pontiella agarivorans]
MKKRRMIIPSVAVCMLLVQSVSAELIYSNNFDTEALGNVGAVGAGVSAFGDVGGPGADANVVAGNANFASQHLEISSRSDNGSYGFALFDGGDGVTPNPGWNAVTTFKFDFRMNSATFTNGQFRLRGRDASYAGTGTDDTARFDISAGDVSFDTVHTIEYVINNSTSDADAPSVGGTISAGSYAIYIDGSLEAGGSNFTAADNSAVDYLTLWVRGDTVDVAQGVVQVDNFEVHAIPEPATLGLVAAFGGAVLFIRRRFTM